MKKILFILILLIPLIFLFSTIHAEDESEDEADNCSITRKGGVAYVICIYESKQDKYEILQWSDTFCKDNGYNEVIRPKFTACSRYGKKCEVVDAICYGD